LSENVFNEKTRRYIPLIKIDVVIPQYDVEAINQALKKIHVGGITILKVKGRGKTIAPEIHASLGTEIFIPEFSDKYILQVVVIDNKEKDVIEIVKANSKMGKIFISPVIRAIDIESGVENEQAI
jgi:nitrogen regulatory protein P-II 1